MARRAPLALPRLLLSLRCQPQAFSAPHCFQRLTRLPLPLRQRIRPTRLLLSLHLYRLLIPRVARRLRISTPKRICPLPFHLPHLFRISYLAVEILSLQAAPPPNIKAKAVFTSHHRSAPPPPPHLHPFHARFSLRRLYPTSSAYSLFPIHNERFNRKHKRMTYHPSNPCYPPLSESNRTSMTAIRSQF